MDALKASVQKFKDKMKKAGLGDDDDEDEITDSMQALGDDSADEDIEKAVAQLDSIAPKNHFMKKIKNRLRPRTLW